MNEECIIADTLRIVDALRILNDLSDTAMTLFVVDNNGCMVGTLTDGDIRRDDGYECYKTIPVDFCFESETATSAARDFKMTRMEYDDSML